MRTKGRRVFQNVHAYPDIKIPKFHQIHTVQLLANWGVPLLGARATGGRVIVSSCHRDGGPGRGSSASNVRCALCLVYMSPSCLDVSR